MYLLAYYWYELPYTVFLKTANADGKNVKHLLQMAKKQLALRNTGSTCTYICPSSFITYKILNKVREP